MGKLPQGDIRVGPETTRVLQAFVQDAASRLPEVLVASPPERDVHVHFQRGPDGNFREDKKERARFSPFLIDDWLHARPNYTACIQHLQSDPLVAQHLDALVGIRHGGGVRLEARNIISSLVYAMIDDKGNITYCNQTFHQKWKEWTDFFETVLIPYKTVAPLPNLFSLSVTATSERRTKP